MVVLLLAVWTVTGTVPSPRPSDTGSACEAEHRIQHEQGQPHKSHSHHGVCGTTVGVQVPQPAERVAVVASATVAHRLNFGDSLHTLATVTPVLEPPRMSAA